MGRSSWPSSKELNHVKKMVGEMAGKGIDDVRVVVSPYRICPLGAHIDHQGGLVSAMTINRGILLGFIPSDDNQIVLRSGQFGGEVRFRVDQILHPSDIVEMKDKIDANSSSELHKQCNWGRYARGAVYALQSKGNHLVQGIIGYICGAEGFESSGLSSSAAVGVAYLLALESANNLNVSPKENIDYDRLIENEYLGLKNGILDQSAILLSSCGCLLCMDCKNKEHKLIHPPKRNENQSTVFEKKYKILLAFSGLKHALTSNPGYNLRVAECQEAAKILLHASGIDKQEPVLSDVQLEAYQIQKYKLEPNLAKRAEHYFSENLRVVKGLEAWAAGNIEDFGTLMTASGLSSIQNYECGSEPLIQLYAIINRAPGVYGVRFSGAGFRGCCVALVDANYADEAAAYVGREYEKVQPELGSQLNKDAGVLICEPGDCARII